MKLDINNCILHIIKLPINIFRYFIGRCRFGQFGRHSGVFHPLRLKGTKNIYIGRHVIIRNYAWLAAVPLTGCAPRLEIQDGVSIGDFAHIVATSRIIIEKDALLANHIYISDNLHSFYDINTPISKQPVAQCNDVSIGEGSWIGENVCIIGASVGKHSVIGANSVVTHEIPDFCVAVGAPARVIKKYDFEKNVWVRV